MSTTPIELFVNFVAGSQGGGASDVVNGAAQTGDYLGVLCLMLFVVLCGASFFLFYKQGLFAEGFTKSNLGKHQKANNFLGSVSSKFSIAITFAVMAAMLICGVFIAKNAFADADQPIVADPEAVTATVNDDGTISFSDCNLKNVTESGYVVDKSSVAVSDDAKSVSALATTQFTIYGFTGVLFDGLPNEEPYTPTQLKILPSGQSTKLSFDIKNLDKESALSLCGKSVFKISLYPLVQNASVVNAPLAKENLKYDETAQEIATVGSAKNGTMKYATTITDTQPEDKTMFNGNMTKETDAGSYYLWYYAQGTDGYGDSDIQGPVICSIEKADSNLQFTLEKSNFESIESESDTAETFTAATGSFKPVIYSVKDNVSPEQNESQYFQINDGLDSTINKLTCKGETPVGEYFLTLTATDSGDQNHEEKSISIETVSWEVKSAAKRVDFKVNDSALGQLVYHPIFNTVPEGVTFYGDDGTIYTSMNANITYAMVTRGDAIIHAARFVLKSWNEAYVIDNEGPQTVYPCEASGLNATFKLSLIGGNENTEHVHRIPFKSKEDSEPAIYEVLVSNIKSAYSSCGVKNQFLSDVATGAESTFYYSCEGTGWNATNRNYQSGPPTRVNLCICRDF